MRFLFLLVRIGVLVGVAHSRVAEIPTIATTSTVSGKAFQRFMTVWLENTDYAKAAGDPNLSWLASQGITLTNYYALTHASQPNYIAVAGGDYFGMGTGDLYDVPSNVSTVVDVLDDKGISWGEYQEDMPSTGFTGVEWMNQKRRMNMYVRRHNPLVSFKSVSKNVERLGRLKNTVAFEEELKSQLLPQWVFVTPNMTSNGHDTSVTTAGKYARGFLEPLLTDPAFKDTLILLTFDENHNYATPNRVFSVLLGGAVPENLRGTTDDNYYDHYSQLSTVQANWGLHHLGRYDAAANVFSLVAAKTGDIVRKHPNPSDIWLNMSYPGVFHPSRFAPISPPNLNLVVNKRTILPAIAERWKAQYESLGTVYDGGLEIPWKGNSPKYIPPTKPEPEKEDSPAGGAESKEGTAAEPGKNTGSAVSALRGSYISTDSGARAAAQEAWSWKHAAWTVVIATAAMGWLG